MSIVAIILAWAKRRPDVVIGDEDAPYSWGNEAETGPAPRRWKSNGEGHDIPISA